MATNRGYVVNNGICSQGNGNPSFVTYCKKTHVITVFYFKVDRGRQGFPVRERLMRKSTTSAAKSARREQTISQGREKRGKRPCRTENGVTCYKRRRGKC